MRLSFGGGRVESHRPSTLAPNNRLAVSWFQKNGTVADPICGCDLPKVLNGCAVKPSLSLA
jgi:hypothetical protein